MEGDGKPRQSQPWARGYGGGGCSLLMEMIPDDGFMPKENLPMAMKL
jgi:hypothetical protein